MAAILHFHEGCADGIDCVALWFPPRFLPTTVALGVATLKAHTKRHVCNGALNPGNAPRDHARLVAWWPLIPTA